MMNRLIAVGTVGAIALVVVSAALDVYWRDPPIAPEVTALVSDVRGGSVTPQQNALLPALAIGVPENVAPGTIGAARFHALIDASLKQSAIEQPAKFFADLADLCDPRANRCYAVATSHPNAARIDALAAKYDVALARYHSLHWFDRYDESGAALALRSSSHLIALRELQRLALSKAFVDAARRDDRPLISALDSDMLLWRSILGGSATRATKRAAGAAIATSAAAISEVLEKVPGFAERHAARLAPMLAPLTEAERSIAREVATELRHDLVRYFAADAWDDRIPSWRRHAPFFMKNATINDRFAIYRDEELPIGMLAPADLLRARAQVPRKRAETLGWLFNPTGRDLLDLERQDWIALMLRIHDVDAMLRLVGAQLHLRAHAIPLDSVGEYLAKLPDARDPYDGGPIRWDREQRMLSVAVNGSDQPASGRIEVRLDDMAQ